MGFVRNWYVLRYHINKIEIIQKLNKVMCALKQQILRFTKQNL